MTAARLKIISGGQTGVDRAALDVAMELGIACGGYCPRGRRAEDGRIPDRYPLTELTSTDYADRTRKNVEVAAGTLVLHAGEVASGTRLTLEICDELGRLTRAVDLRVAGDVTANEITDWIARDVPPVGGVLNVAGPRESESPGIGARAAEFLRRVLANTRDDSTT